MDVHLRRINYSGRWSKLSRMEAPNRNTRSSAGLLGHGGQTFMRATGFRWNDTLEEWQRWQRQRGFRLVIDKMGGGRMLREEEPPELGCPSDGIWVAYGARMESGGLSLSEWVEYNTTLRLGDEITIVERRDSVY